MKSLETHGLAHELGTLPWDHLTVSLKGESMEPLLHAGDRIHLERGFLLPGDIAAFNRKGSIVIHRFLGWWRRDGRVILIFKGDNYPCLDPPIVSSEVIGKVKEWMRGEKRYRENLIQRYLRWFKNVRSYLVTQFFHKTDR